MKVEKFKVLLYLKKSGLDKNGKAPIMGRITLNRTMAQFGCKLSCTPKLWNPRESRLDGKSKEAVEVNAKIDKLLLAINSAYESLVERKTDFDAKAIKDLFQCSADTQMTLLKQLDAIIADIESRIGIDYKKGTLPNYQYTRLTLVLFVKKRYGTDDVAFGELDEQFIREYMDFCLDKRGLALDTVRHYLAILKKTCRIAFKAGHSERYHFMHFKLPQKKENPPKALTREDFLKICDLEIPERRKSLALTRDLFLFACYTGLAYVDLRNLYPHHIGMTADGRKYIREKRAKTNNEAFIPLHPIAEQIMSLYNTAEDSKPVFPLSSRDSMWFEFHSLGVALGINENLTAHVARHTFGVNMVTSGISMESIAKMMGHSNLRSTQIYAVITDNKISIDMDKLMQRRKTKKTDQKRNKEDEK